MSPPTVCDEAKFCAAAAAEEEEEEEEEIEFFLFPLLAERASASKSAKPLAKFTFRVATPKAIPPPPPLLCSTRLSTRKCHL